MHPFIDQRQSHHHLKNYARCSSEKNREIVFRENVIRENDIREHHFQH